MPNCKIFLPADTQCINKHFACISVGSRPVCLFALVFLISVAVLCKVHSVNKGSIWYLMHLFLAPALVCCAWTQRQDLALFCYSGEVKNLSTNGSVCSDPAGAPGLAAGPPHKHGQGSILVFFPGGRGKDKAWIITLPDNARFNEVPEENVSKVLTYLTSVPRYEAPF